MEKDEASTPNKGKDIHEGRASEIEMAAEARASNLEEDKASSPNKETYIEMATNIVEKLDNEMKFSSKKKSHLKRMAHSCIYKVPQPLRKVNCEVYAPQLISIGPLHRGNEKLKAMEKGKRKYFKRLTQWNGMDKKKKCDIVISIKNEEERLRRCYSEKFDEIKSNDFVEMILLDAVFIIQFFLESNDEKGPKSFKPRMTFDIRQDLMLLENQLPLFIIEEIYDQVTSHSSDNNHKSFLDLATCYLREYLHLQVVETSPGVTRPGLKTSILLYHLVAGISILLYLVITDLLRNLMLCKTSPDVEKETSPDVGTETRFNSDVETGFGSDVEKGFNSDVETEFDSDVENETSPYVGKGFNSDVETEFDPDVEKETSLGVEGSRHFTDLLRNLMLCKTSPGVEKETSSGVKKETSPDVETGTSTYVTKEPRHLTDLLRNLMLCKTSSGVKKETSPDVETGTSSGVKKETSPGVEKETSPDVETGTSAGVKKETSPGVEKETSSGVKKETSAGVEKETSSGVETGTSSGAKKETSSGVEKETSSDVETGTSSGVKKETSPGVETGTSSGVKKETSPDVKKEPRHLTDLLRNLMLSRAIKRSYRPDLVKLKYSAIMLRKAGVRFQVIRDECLVNITFDKGVLKIPHLKVDHNFERLVRNIMAMEQCLYERQAYICSYIKFMDQLIDSAGDVGLLVENGIILHRLGDDAEASDMINNLCKNIGDNDTCFGGISRELNYHYENRCNHRKATLKLVYFPNIWRGTGTVAAAILLILTLMQTIKAFL